MIIKLSEKQRIILSSLHLQARASLKEIAKETGYREHSVRHVLESLRQKDALVEVPLIDMGPLGLNDCAVFFSRPLGGSSSRGELIKFLVSSPLVSYVYELAGQYQYCAVVYCRRVQEIEKVLSRVAQIGRSGSFERAIAVRITWSLFRRKYFSRRPSKVEVLSCCAASPEVKIDQLDHQILKSLASSGPEHLARIARTLKTPLTTLTARVKHLERCGIIRGYICRLRHASFGIHKYRVLVTLRDWQEGIDRRIYEFAAQHPHITCYVRCLGNWDFELSLEFEDPHGLPMLLEELQAVSGNLIASSVVLTVIDHRKMCLYPFDEANGPLR